MARALTARRILSRPHFSMKPPRNEAISHWAHCEMSGDSHSYSIMSTVRSCRPKRAQRRSPSIACRCRRLPHPSPPPGRVPLPRTTANNSQQPRNNYKRPATTLVNCPFSTDGSAKLDAVVGKVVSELFFTTLKPQKNNFLGNGYRREVNQARDF